MLPEEMARDLKEQQRIYRIISGALDAGQHSIMMMMNHDVIPNGFFRGIT